MQPRTVEREPEIDQNQVPGYVQVSPGSHHWRSLLQKSFDRKGLGKIKKVLSDQDF